MYPSFESKRWVWLAVLRLPDLRDLGGVVLGEADADILAGDVAAAGLRDDGAVVVTASDVLLGVVVVAVLGDEGVVAVARLVGPCVGGVTVDLLLAGGVAVVGLRHFGHRPLASVRG